MTIEPETIKQRLRMLRQYVAHLEDIRRTPKEEFVSDFHQYWVAERGLQLAAEVVFDTATHILASVYHLYPETNEGALDALHSSGVVSSELRQSMQGFGGFRNILVHRYLEIDEGEVYDHLQQAPETLSRFAKEVLTWLDRLQASEPTTRPPPA
jgi:uncharacterized protein YutE (UPF0331/DUF86 family)